MGTFLSLSGIIGATKQEVEKSLRNYAKSVAGDLQEEKISAYYTNNCCIIDESNGNTVIHYPNQYIEWDESSEFISRELNKPVFSFHIHDGDLWMYILYVNGEIVDRFNPIPEYWDELDEPEILKWNGNASVIIKHCSYLKEKDITNYLVQWDLENENTKKAYPDDVYFFEDWQLTDFMKKLKIPFPLDKAENHIGKTYLLWTKELKLKTNSKIENKKSITESKPRWKFW